MPKTMYDKLYGEDMMLITFIGSKPEETITALIYDADRIGQLQWGLTQPDEAKWIIDGLAAIPHMPLVIAPTAEDGIRQIADMVEAVPDGEMSTWLARANEGFDCPEAFFHIWEELGESWSLDEYLHPGE